jgi:hypothetical protein
LLTQHAKTVKPRSYSEIERYLLTVGKPLHTKPIAAVTRRDVAEVLSAAAANVTKGIGEMTVNRVRSARGNVRMGDETRLD